MSDSARDVDVPSLAIVVEQEPDGSFVGVAAWTDETARGTWEDVYWALMRALRKGAPSAT